MKLGRWAVVGVVVLAGLGGCHHGSSAASDGDGGVCVFDHGVPCSCGGDGYTCTPGTTPDPTLGTCTGPTPNASGDGFCCNALGVACTQASVPGCVSPAYGFSCDPSCGGSSDPTSYDSALTCAAPTVDPSTGVSLYCCTLAAPGDGG